MSLYFHPLFFPLYWIFLLKEDMHGSNYIQVEYSIFTIVVFSLFPPPLEGNNSLLLECPLQQPTYLGSFNMISNHTRWDHLDLRFLEHSSSRWVRFALSDRSTSLAYLCWFFTISSLWRLSSMLLTSPSILECERKDLPTLRRGIFIFWYLSSYLVVESENIKLVGWGEYTFSSWGS